MHGYIDAFSIQQLFPSPYSIPKYKYGIKLQILYGLTAAPALPTERRAAAAVAVVVASCYVVPLNN